MISGLSEAALTDLAKSLFISGEFVAAAGTPMKKPRIALFEPPNSMDAGWTKWVLERYGFSYVLVHPEDFKSPLANTVDVLIVADDARIPVGAGLGAATTGRGRGSGQRSCSSAA